MCIHKTCIYETGRSGCECNSGHRGVRRIFSCQAVANRYPNGVYIGWSHFPVVGTTSIITCFVGETSSPQLLTGKGDNPMHINIHMNVYIEIYINISAYTSKKRITLPRPQTHHFQYFAPLNSGNKNIIIGSSFPPY